MARPRCDGPGAVCSCRADMIHVEQIWLAVEPMDMRAGPDTALARVVKDFGAARPHHAYVFANKRANRLKILVHDGLGGCLRARRLDQVRFVWPRAGQNHIELTDDPLQALVIGLASHRIGEAGIIDVIQAQKPPGYTPRADMHGSPHAAVAHFSAMNMPL